MPDTSRTPEAERIIDLYQRFASDWAKLRGRLVLEKTWVERFLTFLPTKASILDVGCGSGEPIARYLIERGFAVTGIDSSPALIDICKTRFPDQEWVVADMRTLSLEREFDGIVAWDSFFHLCPEDQRLMFPIFRRHGRGKSTLMFTSGPRYGEVIATFMGEPLYHGSLDLAEYRLLLDQNGFDVARHVAEDPDCGDHTV